MVTTATWIRAVVRLRRRLRQVDRVHVLVIGITISVIWAGLWVNLYRTHQRAEDAAVRESSNLARSLEASVGQTFAAVDQSLLFVRELHRRDPGHAAAHARRPPRPDIHLHGGRHGRHRDPGNLTGRAPMALHIVSTVTKLAVGATPGLPGRNPYRSPQ